MADFQPPQHAAPSAGAGICRCLSNSELMGLLPDSGPVWQALSGHKRSNILAVELPPQALPSF